MTDDNLRDVGVKTVLALAVVEGVLADGAMVPLGEPPLGLVRLSKAAA